MPNRQNFNRQHVERTKCLHTKCRTDKMSTDKMYVTPCMQNTEETIAKYAFDANLFRLESTNSKKNIQPLYFATKKKSTFCLLTNCLVGILSVRHFVCSTLCLSTLCLTTIWTRGKRVAAVFNSLRNNIRKEAGYRIIT